MHVNDLLTTAVEHGASDLHLKAGSVPIMRVSGGLVPVPGARRLTHEDTIQMAAAVVPAALWERFKKSPEVDLAYSVAGLGRFRCSVFQQRSTVGLVLRVIPVQIRSIEELHLPAVLSKIADEERGLVLVTGTTGSGKSTTLAGMIDRINRTRCVHVLTVEDPIEFLHKDFKAIINQREVQTDTRSFAHAMRAALRQDPDVILVGEMRDFETAKTGVEASLTGHLVFSTLHTNSAPETIVRLLDMGIDPLNFADSLLGILAQRLVRTLCPLCKEPYYPTAEEFDEIVQSYGPEQFAALNVSFGDELTIYRPKGCEACDKSGYKGRMGIHELLLNTDAMKRLIQQHKSVEEMRFLAITEGMTTLLQDGIVKFLQGKTDFKQVRRVCIK